ncbi:hypothetical protein [Paenibacillus sp. YN15]|uniref:hypothetical protein n=1 Tax=Paenibacillus sp. YN15 TaxID=1742774 RepID=UPI000DCB2F4C|nr:hypothetical protein [Paenibacillus sp. YN15]RAU92487.1 hypothetical protein DQG13_27545 [Paenibacillus sp. YN15]
MNESKYVISSYNLMQKRHIVLDENADVQITPEGERRIKALFNRISPEEKILLDIAFCQAHEIPPKLF